MCDCVQIRRAYRASQEKAARRFIDAVSPEVLITIEVENRPTLGRFNDQVLGAKFSKAYRHLMVVDGNDTRGIDVGIMGKFPIESVRSHVDEPFESKNKVFSRDCPEYDVMLPGGERLVVSHPDYPTDRPGTYGTGLKSGKIDYLICSPKLWEKVKTCGIERRGSYHPGVWAPFNTVQKEADEASDHQCIWMEVDL